MVHRVFDIPCPVVLVLLRLALVVFVCVAAGDVCFSLLARVGAYVCESGGLVMVLLVSGDTYHVGLGVDDDHHYQHCFDHWSDCDNY